MRLFGRLINDTRCVAVKTFVHSVIDILILFTGTNQVNDFCLILNAIAVLRFVTFLRCMKLIIAVFIIW